MGVPWKIVGLAGVAGVAATTGVVVARKRREQEEYDPEQLREKLRDRLAAVPGSEGEAPASEAEGEAPQTSSAS
jgi:hypothetical protein